MLSAGLVGGASYFFFFSRKCTDKNKNERGGVRKQTKNIYIKTFEVFRSVFAVFVSIIFYFLYLFHLLSSTKQVYLE